MEYLFNFYLKFENLNDFSKEELQNIFEEFASKVDFRSSGYLEDEFFEKHKISLLSVDWYYFDEDLLELSEKLPKLKFYVDVYGEGEGNIQRVYFYGGDRQIGRVEVNFEKCLLW